MPVPVDLDDPIRDVDRLRAIARFAFTHVDVRRELDELAQVTAEYLGRPIGLVTLVLEGAQCFAGCHGLDGWMGAAGGTPVEWSFCAEVVRRNDDYVVPDADVDPTQRDNPLVAMDGIRSYAGVPITVDDGHVIGTACVLDREPFIPSAADLEHLRWSARRALTILERTRRPLG